MKSLKVVFATLLLSSVAMANASSVTCTMKNVANGKKDVLTVKAIADTFAESAGLDVPDNSYAFSLQLNALAGTKFDMEVMFVDENDFVGGMNCEFDSKVVGKTFCKDDLTDMDDKKLFTFSCKVVK